MASSPYALLAGEVAASIRRHPLHSELGQLKALSALIGLILGLQLLTIAARTFNGTFWLFRVHTTTGVTPGGTSNFLVGCAIFSVFVQPYIYVPNVAWDTLIWIPLWLGRWIMTWATVLAIIHDLRSFQRHHSASASPSRPPSITRLSLVNTVFALYFIIPFATVLPFSIVAYVLDERARSYTVLLADALAQSVAQPVGAATLVNLFGITARTFIRSRVWLTRVWISWAVLTGTEMIIFIIASALWLRSLRRSLGTIRLDPSDVTPGRKAKFNRAVDGLILTTICSAVIALAHFGSVVYLAIGLNQLYHPEYIVLVVLWAYAVFGGIGTISVLIRSFTLAELDPNARPSPSGTGHRLAVFGMRRSGPSTTTSDSADTEVELDKVGQTAPQPIRVEVDYARDGPPTSEVDSEKARPFRGPTPV